MEKKKEKSPNMPSKTGNPSGPNRDNNPPKKPAAAPNTKKPSK